jgi:RNA polymerase sigma-70 factor, ECF subfamily
MTGNDADAKDATQEALIGIVRGLPRYDGRAAFTTWSYRVAVNASLDELRRRKRRPSPGLPDSYDAADSTAPFELRLDQRSELDDALAALPPEFRAAVVLRDVVDLDYAAIAEVLQIPPGTVRSRISRGRSALARKLAGNQSGQPGRRTGEP